MSKLVPDDKVVFGVVPAREDKAPVIVLGVSEAAWDYMKDGMSHTFDLTKVGLPLQIILFGAKDRQAAMDLISLGMQADGTEFVDKRDTDFSIEP